METRQQTQRKNNETELDQPPLTTPEEQRIYDDMLEKDFIEIDPKTKRPVSVEVFFKVVHVFPQFASANNLEYWARFVIEKFEFVLESDGTKKKRKLGEFQAKANEFRENYIPTITESVANFSKRSDLGEAVQKAQEKKL